MKDWINASQANQALSASDYIITHGCDGPDNKWKVDASEVDNYIISIDLQNQSINQHQSKNCIKNCFL